YVSAQGSDGDNCGRAANSACKTIAQGNRNCSGAGCSVLVRHGLYATDASITLADGISVYGRCRSDGEPDRTYRTGIKASPEPGCQSSDPGAAGANGGVGSSLNSAVQGTWGFNCECNPFPSDHSGMRGEDNSPAPGGAGGGAGNNGACCTSHNPEPAGCRTPD